MPPKRKSDSLYTHGRWTTDHIFEEADPKKLKDLEIRPQKTNKRGSLNIIDTITGRLAGTVDLTDCQPMTLAYLKTIQHRHQIPPDVLDATAKACTARTGRPYHPHAYLYENPRKQHGLPLYHQHKKGQQTWIASDFGTDTGHIEFLKFYCIDLDTEQQTFAVWWVGSDVWTWEPRAHLPFSPAFIDSVVAKGNGPNVRRTCVGGRREVVVCDGDDASGQQQTVSDTMLPMFRHRGTVDEVKPLCMTGAMSVVASSSSSPSFIATPIIFHATDEKCIPFAFFNTIGASKTMAKKLRSFTAKKYSDLTELARNVQPIKFGKRHYSLQHVELADFFDSDSGLFLVYGGGHAIGVDCSKGVIYDSAEDDSKPLTVENLAVSIKYGISEVRKLI